MLIKYHSIDNHYLTKSIEFAKKAFGRRFENCKWSVTEKIHGGNISFFVQPNEQIKKYSRNQEIEDNNFLNCTEIIASMDEKLQPFQDYSNKENITIRLYGELFGKGIQKGVNYGDKKRIIIFNIMVNDVLLSDLEVIQTFYFLDINKYHVKIMGVFDSLEDAIEYDTKFNSTYNDIEDNICEGIVIKPYDDVFLDIHDSPFFLKKKNESFLEKKQKKVKKEKNVRPEVHKWHETFLAYINENTIYSVFSKEGKIQNISELGKYIPLITLDASDTFYRENDFPVNDFNKNEHRYIFNAGKIIADLLKKEL